MHEPFLPLSGFTGWQPLLNNRFGKMNETHHSCMLTGAKPLAVLVNGLVPKDLSQFVQEEKACMEVPLICRTIVIITC
jgi:hypothetical protein